MIYRDNSSDAFDALLGEWDFVVEVRSFRLDLTSGRDWREAFTSALDDWCFVFQRDSSVIAIKEWERDERGTMINRDVFTLNAIGEYRFIERSEIVVPTDATQVECPLVPPPFGYVAVRFTYEAWEDTAKELMTGLIKESMGRIFATEREWKQDRNLVGRSSAAPPIEIRRFEVVCTTLQKFSLYLTKYSIDDGDVLLSRDDSFYVSYVIAAIKEALARDGYTGEVGVTPTSHNPFRYWMEEERFWIHGPNGSRPSQDELESFLMKREFEIWVYDFSGVERLVNSAEVSMMWS
jgi:hypothetical protein